MRVADELMNAIDDKSLIILKTANGNSELPETGQILDKSGGGATISSSENGTRIIYIVKSEEDIVVNKDPSRFIFGPDSDEPLKCTRGIILLHEIGHFNYRSIKNRDTHNSFVIQAEDSVKTLLKLNKRQTHDSKFWKEYWNK